MNIVELPKHHKLAADQSQAHGQLLDGICLQHGQGAAIDFG
jgi:hypothetical protein